MERITLKKNSYNKFIFKGSLALESYYDDTHKNKQLFDDFNDKLKKYRSLHEKTNEAKENIVNELLSTIEQIGEENFIIYDDGDVEYNYTIRKRSDFDDR